VTDLGPGPEAAVAGPSGADRDAWQVPEFECHELAPRASAVCVLIPVLNEGERIIGQLQRMHASDGIPDILIADGGSDDGSMESERLEQLGVRTLLIKKGPGRVGTQLRIGFAYALDQGYEGVVTIDGNGKDDVAAIPDFVAALRGGLDFVQGSRFVAGGEAVNTPLTRWLAIRVLHAPLVSLAAGFRYTDTTNGFRAYSRRLLENPAVQPFRDVFRDYEILWYLAARSARTGHRVGELPVRRAYPDRGPTPTKIDFAGGVGIIAELGRLVLGRFDP